MSLTRGIYLIANGGQPTVNFTSGVAVNGVTPVLGWHQFAFSDVNSLNQLWLVEPTGTPNTFTIQNLRTGDYVDLLNGSVANETPIWGNPSKSNNQVWIIQLVVDSAFYRIQNKQSGTFVDLYYGGTADGTKISGWGGSWSDNVNTHQLWSFQLRSQTGSEIKTTLSTNPYLSSQLYSYQNDGIYLIVDQTVLQSIWAGATLGAGQPYIYRPEIFDLDDFAIAFKAQVAKWGSDNILANGLSLLCGVILFASAQPGQGGQSYNFTLSSDFSAATFFDPQTGQFSQTIGGQLAFF